MKDNTRVTNLLKLSTSFMTDASKAPAFYYFLTKFSISVIL